MSGVYKTEAWLNKYGWTKYVNTRSLHRSHLIFSIQRLISSDYNINYVDRRGKGLGKNENGIKDFIKLDKKDDTVGVSKTARLS